MKTKIALYGLLSGVAIGFPMNVAAQLEIEYLNQPNQVIVSWPSQWGTALEETLTLSDPNSFAPIDGNPVLANFRFSYTKRKNEPEKYFRLQLASGDFSAPVLYPSSNGTEIFAIGDYNGDSHFDAAAISTAQVSRLLGNGTGALGDHTDKRITLSPANISSADFNKDGKDDFVVGDAVGSETAISIFLAGGDDFADATEINIESTFPTEEFVTLTGDFNEDGNADIVAWGAAAGVFFAGNGAGAFTPTTLFERDLVAAFENALSGIMLADVNDDSHLDLVAGRPASRSFRSVLGDGKGGFTETQDSVLPGEPNTLFGVLGVGNFFADPDGKSFDDLLVLGENQSEIDLVKGVGDGMFMEGVTFTVHESGNPNIGVTAAAGDFNDDGFTDFVVSSVEVLPGNQSANHLDLFYNNQQGSFVRREPIVIPDAAIDHMTTFDVNKDGKVDIVGTARNDVVVLLGITGQ